MIYIGALTLVPHIVFNISTWYPLSRIGSSLRICLRNSFTLKDMTKRFLNIIYAGRKTEIEVTGFERLTEVQDKIKEKFANSLAHVDAADIQLCDQQGALIEKRDD